MGWRYGGKEKVFISYKRNVEPDEPVALDIFTQLSKDCDVFIDLKMMVGTKWAREIKDNILGADFFISLISQNSINSDMVSTEIQIAYKHSRTNGKPIILPVRLNYFEDLEYDLTAYLDSRNYLAWKNYADNTIIINQLKQAIIGEKFSDNRVFEIIEQQNKAKENLIRKLLCEGDFKRAAIECEKTIEQHSEVHLIHLLLAIALLSKQGANIYSTSQIKRIEKHLDKACENETVKPTALIVWGIVKHDYYLLNGLYQGTPSFDDIKQSISNLQLDIVDMELIELIQTDEITYKALELQNLLKSHI